MIILRPVDDDNFDNYRRGLNESSLASGHKKYSRQDTVDHINENERLGCGCFVAELDGKPVGTVSYGRYSDLHRMAQINTVSIFPEYRGRGLGKELMHRALYAIAQYSHGGIEKVVLQVNKANSRALKLYRKLGFVQFRDLKDGAILMVRNNDDYNERYEHVQTIVERLNRFLNGS